MADPKPSLVERLFAEHRTALNAFFRRRIRSPADAPDLAQEVYVRMLRLKDQEAIRNPVPYLYTVASNLVKEHAVLDQRQASCIDIDDAPAQQSLETVPEFDVEFDARQRTLRLGIVLNQLSPKCRAAVVLRYTHELSFREIGDQLGVSPQMARKYVVQGLALAWNHSELAKEATLLWQDGTPIDFSALHVPNPGGALGSPLAGAPLFQGNIRARYDFVFNGYAPFAQIDAVYQSHSFAETNNLLVDPQGNSTAYELPGFTTYDGALGLTKNTWLVQVYGENLTDTRAQLYANYWQWYKAITVNRPRTFGLRFSYKFSGS